MSKHYLKNINVLITGNNGYIGSVLTELLLEHAYNVVGYDTGYYTDTALLELPKTHRQIKKDIRDASAEDFKDVDAVLHLAALSNDPLGELEPELTHEINLQATIHLARLAKETGVRRFIYSSSPSIYGIANAADELDEAQSQINPLTVYARTKWDAERALKKMGSDNFAVVCLRLATVFGASPSFRCDLVLNNLVASAYTTGKIKIKSDGTPWRPMAHVRDVAQAFKAALEAPQHLVGGESFHVGTQNGNFTVRVLAEAAQRAVPGSDLVFTGEHGPDSRSYRVSFQKILNSLKEYYQPEWDIDRGARELVEFFKKINFTEEQFLGRTTNRLQQIKFLTENGRLDKSLRWAK